MSELADYLTRWRNSKKNEKKLLKEEQKINADTFAELLDFMHKQGEFMHDKVVEGLGDDANKIMAHIAMYHPAGANVWDI